MPDFLDKIIERKRQEIAKITPRQKLHEALRQERMAVIAEIKRKSPSAGDIATIDDPVALACRYRDGEAAALSILTDREGFGGSLQDLHAVACAVEGLPLLRKDFIIDPVQIGESVRYGASAVLLIVAALGNRTSQMLEEVHRCGLEALVEVHDENELHIALAAGAKIIGVNNRNLHSFEVDLKTATRLAPLIPDAVIKVAESGIRTAADVNMMRDAGFDAVLVGEVLVRAEDPAAAIARFRLVRREAGRKKEG